MDRIANTIDVQLFDADEIRRAWELLILPGQVVELRALDAMTIDNRWPHTVSGYFDDVQKAIEAVGTIREAKGIYFTANPVNPALLARAANRLKRAEKGTSTADTQIIARRWLLVDCDPVCPASDISATDDEHKAAIKRARAIHDELHFNFGFPDPIAADSGNGAHLIYLVDLPVDDAGLVQRCLLALAAKFDDDAVKVDTSVFNPARIWKLYGTTACKGDSIPDRPHRLSKILSAPSQFMRSAKGYLRSWLAAHWKCSRITVAVTVQHGSLTSMRLSISMVLN